jgi:predicted methyltransferase
MRAIAVSIALVIATGVLVDAQRRHPVSGRIFAPVMGVGGAGWLERPERENEEAPSRAIEALDLKPGMVVADIGAGSGYYASRMAKRVGPTGRVYAIMVDVYHELQEPQVFLQRLKEVFKPGGRLVLVEFRKEDPKVPILEVHKMSVAEVKQELEAEGYVLDRVIDVLPWQHIIVLRVK